MIDPLNSMDCCNSLEFPKMRVLFVEMQANKTQIQTNPNIDFEKSLWLLSRPLKLLTILLLNHQYQLLNRSSISLSTLRSGFSHTFPQVRDLKSPLQQLPYTKKPKPHYLSSLLHIFPLLLREISA